MVSPSSIILFSSRRETTIKHSPTQPQRLNSFVFLEFLVSSSDQKPVNLDLCSEFRQTYRRLLRKTKQQGEGVIIHSFIHANTEAWRYNVPGCRTEFSAALP
ncbi:hypothetical protein GQ457_12G023420 [Hibiscus cannabinus]